jgi:hypothetical protein
LIMQDVWRQLFTFLYFMFLIFHLNFHNAEYQLTVLLDWYIHVYHWKCMICT